MLIVLLTTEKGKHSKPPNASQTQRLIANHVLATGYFRQRVIPVVRLGGLSDVTVLNHQSVSHLSFIC